MVQVIILASTSVCLVLETLSGKKKKKEGLNLCLWMRMRILESCLLVDGDLDNLVGYECCFPGIGLC